MNKKEKKKENNGQDKLEENGKYNEIDDYYDEQNKCHINTYALFKESLDDRRNTKQTLKNLLQSRHAIKIKKMPTSRPELLDLLCKHLTVMHVQGTFHGVSLLEMVCLYQTIHMVPSFHVKRWNMIATLVMTTLYDLNFFPNISRKYGQEWNNCILRKQQEYECIYANELTNFNTFQTQYGDETHLMHHNIHKHLSFDELRESICQTAIQLGDRSHFNFMMPLIIYPERTTCIYDKCGEQQLHLHKSKKNGQFAYAFIYTMRGTFIGIFMTYKCIKCNTIYQHGQHLKRGAHGHSEQIFKHAPYENIKYHISSEFTAFSVELLKDVDSNIVVAAMAFNTYSNLYNDRCEELHLERFASINETKFKRNNESFSFELNRKRLVQGWFGYKILQTCDRLQINLEYIDFCSSIKSLTKVMYDLISPLPSEWIDHVCSTPGCQEVIVLDGNEKLHRPMCAAPADAVDIPPEIPAHANFQRFFSTCIHDPIRKTAPHKKKQNCQNENDNELLTQLSQENENENIDDMEIFINIQKKLDAMEGDDEEDDNYDSTQLFVPIKKEEDINLQIKIEQELMIQDETNIIKEMKIDSEMKIPIKNADKILSRKGFCEAHQFCLDPNWRFNKLNDQQKTIWELAKLKEEQKIKMEEEIKRKNVKDMNEHIDAVGLYITPRELSKIHSSYKLKLKQELSKIHFGEKPTQKELRKSERAKKLAKYANFVPESVMDIMVLSTNDVPSDQVLFPDAFKIDNGCKKAENVDRFYDRTAGILCGMKPCGIIVWFAEMFKAESPTHVAITLAHEYMKNERTMKAVPKLIVYDRACDLEPTVNELLRNKLLPVEVFGGVSIITTYDLDFNEQIKEINHPAPLYMVDRMHVHGHKEKECLPKGRYHYKSDRFQNVLKKKEDFAQVNTEICESRFYHFGKYKHIAKHFTRFQFWFYLYAVIHMSNERVVRRLNLNYNQKIQIELNKSEFKKIIELQQAKLSTMKKTNSTNEANETMIVE